MNNSTQWAVTYTRMAAGLPAAIEAAETLGAVLAPGRPTGPAKLEAVKHGLAAAAGVQALIDPASGVDPQAASLAVTGIIDAAVALRNLFVKAHPPAAPAPPVSTAPPAPPVVAAVAPTPPPPGGMAAVITQLAAPAPAAPEVEVAAAAAAPAIVEIKPGVREVNGVRQVWDEVSQVWSTPGR